MAGGLAPGGSRKLPGIPPGNGGGDVTPDCALDPLPGPIVGERFEPPPGGAPCRPKCTAWILAKMSCETLRPLPRLEMVAGAFGRGFLAAFIFPRGDEDEVMLAAITPEVDVVRIAGRGTGERAVESTLSVESAGDGKSSRPSASNSLSGVDAMVANEAFKCSDGAGRRLRAGSMQSERARPLNGE